MKSRPYRMRRRAEQVDETRLRITEAAVRLHTSIGPASTSIASVADEAGVTRLTVYRHFADLESLFAACTAHWRARNPPPNAAAWLSIPDVQARARRAFGELYGWYAEHADELYPVYRDTAAMPATAQREREATNHMLADAILGRGPGQSAGVAGGRHVVDGVARHLVHFWTWRSLVVEQGLSNREAVDVAVSLLMVLGIDDARDEDAAGG